jgi:hypothetical protein
MRVTSSLNKVSCGLIALACFVNGFAIGLPQTAASCQTPECTEVILVMDLAQLATAPPTKVNASDIYDDTQAIVLYSPSPHGGTVTTHATAKNQKRTECSYWWGKLCASNQTDGLYETKFWKEPLIPTCKPPAQVDRTFCAGPDGEGVTDSWHEGKKKDEEPE